MANKKFDTVTFPEGTILYPKLVEPDYYKSPDGTFKLTLVLESNDPNVEVICKKIEGLVDEQHAAAMEAEKNPAKRKKLSKCVPWEDIYDDEGEPTGQIQLKIKHHKVIRYKKAGQDASFEWTPALYDGQRNFIPVDQREPLKKLWSGTKGRVAVELVPYTMASTQTSGVSLRMSAVQLTHMAFGGQPSADALGFEADGEAFVAPPPAQFGDDEDGDDGDKIQYANEDY